MNETLGVIVVLAVIGGLVFLHGRMGLIVNHIFRGSTIRESRSLVERVLNFAVPTSAAETMQAIVRSVDPHDARPILKGGVYVKHQEPDHVTLALGNRLADAWCFEVMFAESKDSPGGQVVCTVSNYLQTDGIVNGTRELSMVHERINRAATKLKNPTAP